MTNPTLSSPKYASPESLEFQMHKKQENRKRRNKSQPPSERFFRRNEGTTDYIDTGSFEMSGNIVVSLKFNTASMLENTYLFSFHNANPSDFFGVSVSKNGAGKAGFLSGGRTPNQTTQLCNDGLTHELMVTINITTGALVIYIDGVEVGTSTYSVPSVLTGAWDLLIYGRKEDVTASIGAVSEGVVWDFEMSIGGTPSRGYAIDDNSGTIKDSVGGFDGTVVNGNNDDWSKFFRSGKDWVGEELVTQDVWENPNVIRSEWNFANNQWTLTGLGSSNLLQLVATSSQPPLVILIGNCAAISGTLSTSASTSLNVISTTGIYSEIIDTTTFRQLYKRAAGIVNATLDKPSMRAIIQGI